MPSYPTFRFQDQDLIRIGDERDALLLAPWAGGRLVRWIHRGADILYWPDNADWSRPAKVRGGNPLLFPFIGRHFVDGEPGQWRDGNGVVRSMPQHGSARDLPFTVVECDPARSITMALTDSDATRDAYPFSFRFEVGYRLLDDGLEASFTVRNLGSEPLPFYAGHHFYFSVPHGLRQDCRLTLPPAQRVRQRPDGSLTAGEPGDPSYALDDPRLQDTFHRLDAAGGVAELTMPCGQPALAKRQDVGQIVGPADMPAKLPIDMPADMLTNKQACRTLTFDLGTREGTAPWRAITTWSEREDADYYCVEPWLGLPDAIHRQGEARWVQPGETVRACCIVRARW